MLRYLLRNRPLTISTKRTRFNQCFTTATQPSRSNAIVQHPSQCLLRVIDFRRPTFSAFDLVRQRYFSNAAALVEDEDTEASSVGMGNSSSDSVHSKKYLSRFYRFFFHKHGLKGKQLRGCFEYELATNVPIMDKDVPDHIKHQTVTRWWTATFTDPVTQEAFGCIQFPDVLSIEIDGKHHYMKKKYATNAAVTHFMQEREIEETSSQTEMDEVDLLRHLASVESHPTPFSDSKLNPRSLLQNKYAKYKIFPTSDNIRYMQHHFCGEAGREGKGGTWWTCSFQCPVKLQWYDASDLNQVSPNVKMNHGGRIWYRTKPNAMHAASAKVLESIDWDNLRNEIKDEKVGSSSVGFKDPRLAEFEFMVQPLIDWFKQEYHMSIDVVEMESYFVATEKVNPENLHHWTASFINPISGERFDSGTINNTSSVIIDGFVWYSQKQLAIQAAALRAYDILNFRKSEQAGPRFCREHPSSDTFATPDVVSLVGGRETRRNHESIDGEPSGKEGGADRATYPETVSDFDVDEEDYVIELIPQKTLFGRAKGFSTLDIIAETWIESTRISSCKDGEDTRIENIGDTIQQRQEAIDRALKWLREHDTKSKQSSSGDRTNLDVGGQITGMPIANVILSSLAETHQRVPFDSRLSGVEEAAKSILQSMLTSKQYALDADTYAYYLKCLEGETPEAVAQRACDIVSEMESGRDSNGRPLPLPNASVYASLFQVKSLTGKIALCADHRSVSPTREMFLAAFAAMAHDPSSFSVDAGMELIDRMDILWKDSSDPALKPDTEIFNAALRWSGGPLWTRRFSRAIPWDSYCDIFKDGFLLDNSPSNPVHDQAWEMERWLECLENRGLSPTVETFESIIQTWVRCGTKLGLQKAEEYANRLISGQVTDVNPRLQTFYPILAAWAYSGSIEGPNHAVEWITRIQDVFGHINVRRRFVSLPFLSSLETQKQLSISASTCEIFGEKIEMRQMMQNTADRAVSDLQDLIDEYKAIPSYFLPQDVFALTGGSFHVAAMASESMDDLEECFAGIRKMELLYEDFIVWLYRNQTEQTKFQLVHLLRQAPSIYSTYLFLLDQCIRISGENGEIFDITVHLLAIEEKIRRSREFVQSLDDIEEGILDGSLDLGDSDVFPIYNTLDYQPCQNWSAFRAKALAVLKAWLVQSTPNRADVVRLCFEMANVADSTNATVQVIDFLTDLLKDGWAGNDRELIQRTITILKKDVTGNSKEKDRPKCDLKDETFLSSTPAGTCRESYQTDIEHSSRSLQTKKAVKSRRNRSRPHSSAPKRPARRSSKRPRPTMMDT